MTTAFSLDQASWVIEKSRVKGASDAEVLFGESTSLSVEVRNGKLEALDQAASSSLTLRVFIGKKQALVSTNDITTNSLDQTIERAVDMAKAAPEDPFCGLALPDQTTCDIPHLFLYDVLPLPLANDLTQTAVEIENEMMAVNGVSLSSGAGASAGHLKIMMMTSHGFHGEVERSNFNLSATAIAGNGTDMMRDYDHQTTVFREDLSAPSVIGRCAGERAVKRLNSRKMTTTHGSVVFAPRVANSLVGHFISAINGASIARKTSFLKDSLHTQLFPENITIIDDPFLKRGLRSRPFDGEGLPPSTRRFVDRGILTSWMLDLRSARQLGLTSTAHAGLRASGLPSPSPSNLWIEAGQIPPDILISDIKNGFYVTDLMGDGFNQVTGDYSRAASGFWIENGHLSFPVNEMTIAGNMKDMFARITAANDLEFKYGIDSPTLRVDGMMIAGS